MTTWIRRLRVLFAILVTATAWLHPAVTALAQDMPVMTAAEFPTPERPIHNGVDYVGVEVSLSDNLGFNTRFSFPQPHLWTVKEGSAEYVQYAIPGMEQAYGVAGMPAIPFYSRLVAVPQGQTATVTDVQLTPRNQLVNGVVYPVQPEPLDAAEEDEFDEFDDPPFVIDTEYYSGTEVFPQPVVRVEPLGKVRWLNLYRISIATGRYNPEAHKLQLFESVGVKVRFSGGDDNTFSTRRDNLAFNDRIDAITELTINYHAPDHYVNPNLGGPFLCLGTEFLIITHPDFRAAADDLQAWKQAKGISTAVVEVGTDPGQIGETAADIQLFIRNRYNNCMIQLSYVLLLGDADFVVPYYRLAPDTGDLAGTDLDYALMDNFGILPDLAVGRIPVDTLTQAQDVVDKTINYEQNPPNVASFYDNAAMASYFQCCRNDVVNDGTDTRSFVETVELVRDELMDEGYTVNRIYTTDNDRTDDPTDPTNFYDETVRDTTPNRYYNNALLPSDLRASSGYPWNGNTTDVIDAFNDGNFLIIHRDHGSITSWGDPSFSTFNHGSLTNGALTPIVYSINCVTGIYDNETRDPANDVKTYNTTTTGVYFAESLLRIPDGGAVGIIGDVRNSPSWANSALTRGLVDATWYGTVPGNGNRGTSLTRLGDILNYGKVYLEGQVGVAQTAGSISSTSADHDVIIYNVFGDPTLEMWTNNPHPFSLSGTFIPHNTGPRTWHFAYANEGATITAMQDGRPLAQGVVENGSARLVFIAKRNPNEPVDFIADHPDTLPVHLHIRQTANDITKEQGGVLGVGGVMTATFPSNAVTETVELIHTELISPTAPLPQGRQALRSFLLDAEGGNGDPVDQFAEPFQLKLCNPDATVGIDVWEHAVINFFDEDTGAWTPLPTTFDPATGCLSTEVDHLTEFAVLDSDDNSGGNGEGTVPLYLPALSR